MFCIAGRAPGDLVGGHLLARNWRPLSPTSHPAAFRRPPGKAWYENQTLELSRACIGPKQFDSQRGPQSGGHWRTGVLWGPPFEGGCGRALGISDKWLTALVGLSLPSPLQPGEEMEACEELALALSRGLQLDTQRSSRDSLQCSSGYSTQTTTPCCSEDTIPSQGRRQPGLSSRASSAVPAEEGALPAGGGRRLATAEQLGMLWRARLSLSGSCHPRQ